MKKEGILSKNKTLRQKAEMLLEISSNKSALPLSEADIQRIVHELEVHRLELELQNEELSLANEKEAIISQEYIELYDFAPTGYFTLSQEGKIIKLNLLGAKMLGKEQSQLKNRLLHLFISDDSKPLFITFLEKIFHGKNIETCEVTLSNNEQSPVYVQLTGIFNANDKQCLITAIDITERKQAEEQIHKLSQAIEQSPVSIIITNTEGKIDYANPIVHEITGYKQTEIIGKNPRIFISEKNAQNDFKDILDAISKGKIWRGEIQIKKKNGELYWGLVSISPIINDKGKITHYLTVKEDITELKKIEHDLILEKEHAEESDRLKSAFLANMSHEIRTPMNGILGFTELLEKPDLTGEQQQKFIQIIQKSGTRMLNIINDIVDISKIESGQIILLISETDVNELIDSIYSFFKPEVEQKGMQLNFNYSLTGKNSIIKTDQEKLYAILTNLIKNAIKFTEKGSIEIGYKSKLSELEFYVKDTGVGISQDQIDVIFKRFRQVNEKPSRNYEGAGLGLSISKAYVEMLGGKIWVKSELGIGSTFCFTIPVQVKSKVEKFERFSKLTLVEKKRIENLKLLIVEDDEISNILISAMVNNNSNKVIYAKTGIEAIEACRKHPEIDLILMDIRMPEMDGFEATRQIREFNKDIIIIAQTAYGFTGDRENALKAGCNDYISKPILIEKLQALMKKYFIFNSETKS